jgi:hypothetical protein
LVRAASERVEEERRERIARQVIREDPIERTTVLDCRPGSDPRSQRCRLVVGGRHRRLVAAIVARIWHHGESQIEADRWYQFHSSSFASAGEARRL